MSDKATYQDADLILKLYEIRREEKMREARQWFAGQFRASSMEEFGRACPPGSQESAYFRMVTSYWDMAGLFVAQGVLNEELFVRSAGESLLVWEKVRPFIGELREAFSNPTYLENLEAVAEASVARMKESAPGAYESFVSRVIGR